MKLNRYVITTMAVLFTVSGYAIAQHHGEEKMALKKDGDIAMPSGFEKWPTFATHINKEGPKQVRDIYINKTGEMAKNSKSFPNGTTLVMAIYKAEQNADGSLKKSANGSLIKDSLSKVFVMEKGKDWGMNVADNLKNGDWIYAAYNADGTKADVKFEACRSCHLPKADTDFVFHTEKYFKM